MLNQTSELAIRALVFLALETGGQPVSPRSISGSIHCSASYLAKTLTRLVRAGLLRSVRGVRGGVVLAKAPEEISLLEVFEACQGILIGNYCRHLDQRAGPVCSYHEAMQELHRATVETLSHWTLQDLLEHPAQPSDEPEVDPEMGCKMFFEGCDKHLK